jgi:hypothetical protein
MNQAYRATVHGDLVELRNEQQNIEQGTPNVEGETEIPVKWEPQLCIDESG